MAKAVQVWRGAGLLLTAALAVGASAQWTAADPGIPAFHKAAATGLIPALLPDSQRIGPYFTHSYQHTAYHMADAVPQVLYQQPCYCWCSKAMGHKSLHSCFEGSHGAVCATCMKEAAYAYQQTRLGKTPAEIRAGIVNGDWTAVDLRDIKLDE